MSLLDNFAIIEFKAQKHNLQFIIIFSISEHWRSISYKLFSKMGIEEVCPIPNNGTDEAFTVLMYRKCRIMWFLVECLHLLIVILLQNKMMYVGIFLRISLVGPESEYEYMLMYLLYYLKSGVKVISATSWFSMNPKE